MLNNPLVSIVISTYNRDHILQRAVSSALSQSYENIEIIISDDCSSDDTKKVGERLARDNIKVKYFRNSKNLKTAGNWKKAFFEYATGDLITVLNDDDEFIDSDFITKAVGLFEKYKDDSVVCVFSNVLYKNYYEKLDFYEDSLSYTEPFPKLISGEELFYSDAFIHTDNGAIYKKEALLDLELFNHNIFTLDVEMMYKLMSKGQFCYIDNPTYLHYFDDGCLSRANSKKFLQAMQSTKWIEIVYEFYKSQFGESVELSDWLQMRSKAIWKSLLYRIEFDYEVFLHRIITDLPRNSEIYIFGTGKGAEFLYHLLKEKRDDIKVVGFIDDYKKGRFFDHDIVTIDSASKTLPVVLGLNDYSLAHKIVCRCVEAGFEKNKIYSIL